jgi:glycosyltransferase involved in cell wall biosynthesis
MQSSTPHDGMKRVGLYLGFPPHGGGAFQYAQSVLAATLSLPASEYDIVIAHAHPAWLPLLQLHATRAKLLPVPTGLLDPVLHFLLRQGLSIKLWRTLARRVHPGTRRLLAQDCGLWICPAQDVLTYTLPAKTIGVIHDLMHRYESRFPEVSHRGLFKRRERHYRNICAAATAILVDSIVGKMHVMESYDVDPARLHVLPYVAPPYMRNAAPADFHSRYLLPASFIFYPAQFWEHKNHLRLLQAFSIALESVPDLHLVLSGSGKNADAKVRQTIDTLNLQQRVKLLGYVPDADMPGFYQLARALVMPTFFGPTNIPPLEAMVAGCPMAVSNIYAMPEQVGDAALLFDPYSVEEIARAMVLLATDEALRSRLSEAGRKRAQQWDQPHFEARFHQIVQIAFEP